MTHSAPGLRRPTPGHGWRLYVGDAARVPAAPAPGIRGRGLHEPPPFCGLRDYGAAPDELGHEPSPQEYVGRLLGVMTEVRRVLRPTGSLWMEVASIMMDWDAAVARWRQDRMALRRAVLILPDGRPLAVAMEQEGWQLQDWLRIDRHTGPFIWYGLPRHHGKSATAAAEVLAEAMLAEPGAQVLLFATDAEQAAVVLRYAKGYVNRHPALREAFRVYKNELVIPSTEVIVKVMSSDAASSWGTPFKLAVVDEFAAWLTPNHESLWDSIFTGALKANGRVLVITTAGSPGTFPHSVLEAAKEDPVNWVVVERQGVWASWLPKEKVEAQRKFYERRGALNVFKRLFENLWVAGSDAFLPPSKVEAVFDPTLAPRRQGVRGHYYFGGLDLGVKRDRAALAVVHAEIGPDGKLAKVLVDALFGWEPDGEAVPLEEVERTVRRVAADFPGFRLRADPHEAALLLQRLQRDGIRAEEVPITTGTRGELYGLLAELVNDERLKCFPHPELRAEMLNLRWTERGSTIRPDHPAGGHDDLCMALMLAARAAVEWAGQASPPVDPADLRALQHMRIYVGSPSYGGDWAAESDAALFAAYRGKRKYLDEADPSELIPKPKVGPGGIVTM